MGSSLPFLSFVAASGAQALTCGRSPTVVVGYARYSLQLPPTAYCLASAACRQARECAHSRARPCTATAKSYSSKRARTGAWSLSG